MGYTDRHQRRFMRLISKDAMLYTEMITAQAVIHGDQTRLLGFTPEEQPLALQLGGCCPKKLAMATNIGSKLGYKEINLNLGCPSSRAQDGTFGAGLMTQPELVSKCINAMSAATQVPVTLKCRIGVDAHNSYEYFKHFIDYICKSTPCRTFIVHARIALLSGLSPKENRNIPPLRYDYVYRLKHEYPDLKIIINGGITSITEAKTHLAIVDGVMIGRRAYHDPWSIAVMQNQLFTPQVPIPSRTSLLGYYLPYVQNQLDKGLKINSIIHHLYGLFHCFPGGNIYRRYLSEHAHKPNAGIAVLKNALRHIAE